ncbi:MULTISPECIES: hypothetical protein [Agrobacterium]|jgi:hypothetical protein|uniref:Uncharacterized protein n=1 Tax=Agrobacterium rosae TaxID=1972867 RepID=A0A1R3TNB6_9HYPH|nr:MULTISPECIES: hypothetical protein [Agrobacterium]KAA3511626.1 hypothetical protein DXM21_14375 [Agrobacterium rosae]KAA3518950.1 hypothetical protein DXM25_13640 [Agrobacterium rosae]MBN7806778.1 hypothetical protein [Agrobacterium rosae]MCM2435196.1 hypothetical protein [Agrobacterium rosae]MDX8304048.1 hypothetical protein [Agrobacterium rosae]
MDEKQIMAALAQAYWGRPAVEPELVAMTGELARDSATIAPPRHGQDATLFDVEPAHYDALMLTEAKR